MRATLMFGAGDVRIEKDPDTRVVEANGALVADSCAGNCGIDLWAVQDNEYSDSGRCTGQAAIGVDVARMDG